MRIGVKYCGGCNPMFDRAKLVRRLQEEFPAARIVAATDDSDYTIVVCGCARACVEHGGIRGTHGKWVATCADEYEALRREIRRALEV